MVIPWWYGCHGNGNTLAVDVGSHNRPALAMQGSTHYSNNILNAPGNRQGGWGRVTWQCSAVMLNFLKNKANLRDLIAATGLVISNWIKIVNFSARVTVKFDGWPCKTIGHLFYATSSFVHLFVPIGEFKLKLQSGNAQSGSNWMIFRAVRPWNLTDDLAKQ